MGRKRHRQSQWISHVKENSSYTHTVTLACFRQQALVTLQWSNRSRVVATGVHSNITGNVRGWEKEEGEMMMRMW